MLFLHFRLSEQAEVHAAVCPVLNESGHILKAACKRRQTVNLWLYKHRLP